jgi:hypothetical protein
VLRHRRNAVSRQDYAGYAPADIAAALAFPDGSMAAAGLRRELNKLNDSASISAPGN